jgi:hypothetical protein
MSPNIPTYYLIKPHEDSKQVGIQSWLSTPVRDDCKILDEDSLGELVH